MIHCSFPIGRSVNFTGGISTTIAGTPGQPPIGRVSVIVALRTPGVASTRRISSSKNVFF
jgi:hypothetical protein